MKRNERGGYLNVYFKQAHVEKFAKTRYKDPKALVSVLPAIPRRKLMNIMQSGHTLMFVSTCSRMKTLPAVPEFLVGGNAQQPAALVCPFGTNTIHVPGRIR
jgi:hypothetical protein